MRTRIALFTGCLTALILLQTAIIDRPPASSAAPAADSFIYLPAVRKPILEDVTVDRLIISQATQDDNNTVSLVAQRATVVRVFARRINGNIPGNVTVSLSATRGSSFLGTLVSPPRAVPDTPSRAVLDSTFNFLLPANWLSGNVSLVATVDSAGTVVEANETNNVFQQTVSFHNVPTLMVKIVPVHYTHTGSKAGFYPGQQTDITAWLRRTFPISSINVQYHPTGINFTGNLDQGSEWGRLLDAVTTLKSNEVGMLNPTVYYALVPISNGVVRWFDGGVAGIGWIGARISTGLNLSGAFGSESSGILAAHEIGHNFGRRHAPCGVPTSEPFPYSGASIGQYGLDITGSSFSLLKPEDGYVDMMSYCSPEWISDFTYQALYVDQRANGLQLSAPPQDSLVIRASFDQDGLPTVQPTYIMPELGVSFEPTVEGYEVELLGADGRVIASHPVQVWQAEEPGVTVQSIRAAVPLPDRPVAAVRLVQAGKVVALRALASPGQPLHAEVKTVSGATAAAQTRLTWNAPDTPAMVRYTADDGQSWISLGVDLMGGELLLDGSRLPGRGGRFEITLADRSVPQKLTVASTAP